MSQEIIFALENVYKLLDILIHDAELSEDVYIEAKQDLFILQGQISNLVAEQLKQESNK